MLTGRNTLTLFEKHGRVTFFHKQTPIFLEIQTNTKHPSFCSGLALSISRGSVSIYPRYEQEKMSAKNMPPR